MEKKKIKLIAPLSSVDEARTLPALGADEFYFSVQPSGAKAAVSRRELSRANFSKMSDAALAIEAAHKRGCKAFLALNKVYYIDEELPAVLRMLGECAESGADGVIAADPGLLRILHRDGWHKRIEIVLSTVAAPLNTAAVEFYKQFGISRVILPRHISPAQSAAFVKKHRDIEFEVFIFNWHCMNIDGVCRFQHDVPDAAGMPSLTRNGCCLEYDVEEAGGSGRIAGCFKGVYAKSAAGCAVCSMYDFANAGITDFKIVGRLLSTADKQDSVRFIAECASILEKADTREKYIRLTRRHYEKTFGKPCEGFCYHGIRE